MRDYTPHGDTAQILDRAFEIIHSVPYQVSARWLFYQLLQQGYYGSKGDYKNKFIKAVSSARHAFYKDWRPDTLADDTREAIIRGDGEVDVVTWLDMVTERLTCRIDKWVDQDYYVELWFEARAMTKQFEYYTKHITLRPMGGQPSIDYKWQTAKALEGAAEDYGLPIVVLYFGDLDNAGEMISEVIERDVRTWCEADFAFIRCGLTQDQVDRYHVPENFEKPGEYQWEALGDDAAREIIHDHIAPFVRLDAFSKHEREEHAATVWIRQRLTEIKGEWVTP